MTAPGVAWVGIDSDVVARDAGGGVHLLDARAALVWAYIDGRRTRAEIADAVATWVPETTTSQRATITTDVLTLLEGLCRLELVLVRDDGRAGQVLEES